jgi:hypothetical protein
MDHAPRGSCDSAVRKVARSKEMANCTSAPEPISQASRSLRYIKIRLHAWRIWRKGDAQNMACLEALDEWEGPVFFHVPSLPRWKDGMSWLRRLI